MKEEKYNWQWCWECDCATIESPNKRENTCCSFWGHDENSPWHDEMVEYLATKPKRPEAPTQEDIDIWVQNIKSPWTEEDKLICAIFNRYKLEESDYYNKSQWAKSENLIIPTMQELEEQTGEQFNMDCKTGFDWNVQENELIDILEPTGWLEGTYETERIPWNIFTKRRRKSSCNFENHIKLMKETNNIDYTIAYEAKPGQIIEILENANKGKKAEIIQSDATNGMMLVNVEGKENNSLLHKRTAVNIV